MDPELKLKAAEFIGAWAIEVMETGAEVGRVKLDKQGRTVTLSARRDNGVTTYGSDYQVSLEPFASANFDAAWLGAQEGKKAARALDRACKK